MPYKTFRAHTHYTGWSSTSGRELCLMGQFDWGTAPSFRRVRTLVLCEQVPAPEQQRKYGPEWWFVPADTHTLDRATELMQQDRESYNRPEIIIRGRGRQVDGITPYMGVTAE